MLKKSDALKKVNEVHDSSERTIPEAPLFATAVILAGGASRRMGFDKQTLKLDGRSLIERTVEQLGELFDDIIIVTDRPQLYRDDKVRLASDIFPGGGPIAGIHAGLLQAKSRFVYVIGCDMPYIEKDYINFMKRKLESADVGSVAGCMMRRETGYLEPLNAFYSATLAEALAKELEDGDRSLQFFCRNKPFLWVTEEEGRTVSPELRMFRNINDFADLIDARGGAAPPTSVRSERVQAVTVTRVTEAGEVSCEDYVVREGYLSLIVDGVKRAELYALPERWRDLAVGWLYSEGVIGAAKEVLSFDVGPIAGRMDAFAAHIVLKQADGGVDNPTFSQPLPQIMPNGEQLVAASVYVGSRKDQDASSLAATAGSTTDTGDDPYAARDASPHFPLEVAGEIMGHLDGETSLFRETGGTHSMILFSLESREVTGVCEDTSRHACLDKLIGRAILDRRELNREGLAMSCRVTTTIMRKIIRAGIPVVISRAATTAAAVQLAREAGIILICFARGRRYNLMT